MFILRVLYKLCMILNGFQIRIEFNCDFLRAFEMILISSLSIFPILHLRTIIATFRIDLIYEFQKFIILFLIVFLNHK